MFFATSEEKAYLAPFLIFYAFLLLSKAAGDAFDGLAGAWWISEPRFWIFPLQTAVCGFVLARSWTNFHWRWPAQVVFTVAVGTVVLLLWIAPQLWLGFPARRDGFDPTHFAAGSWGFRLTVALRFLRLVVVVPLVEEIFWRGFLLRYFIRPDFTKVPFGSFSWLSCGLVTLGFCLEHQTLDWPAAALAGLLYNLVAYRTRSLASCVLAHAVTNLLLGLFVMHTGQWGFW